MKQLRVVLGLVISAVFLYFAFRGVAFGQVWGALREANYLWLLPGVAAILASIALRAVRWRLLFYPRTDLRYSSTFGALNVGYLVNDLLPLRLGEVVRAYLLSQLERVSAAHALSTVVVERGLDFLVTLAYLAAVLSFVSLPAGIVGALRVATIAIVGGMAVIFVAGARPRRARALLGLVTRHLPARLAERADGVAESFLRGFAVLSTPRVALPVLALSAVIWGLAALGLYCVLFAFHLYLSPAAPIFVLALVSLSFVLPASPGHVGVFHGFVVLALQAFDVEKAQAQPYALVAHIVAFAPPMVLGATFLWRMGMSWERVVALRRAAAPAEAVEPEPAGRPRG
jgi:uncharacterized protein (TIRG00374 family)